MIDTSMLVEHLLDSSGRVKQPSIADHQLESVSKRVYKVAGDDYMLFKVSNTDKDPI